MGLRTVVKSVVTTCSDALIWGTTRNPQALDVAEGSTGYPLRSRDYESAALTAVPGESYGGPAHPGSTRPRSAARTGSFPQASLLERRFEGAWCRHFDGLPTTQPSGDKRAWFGNLESRSSGHLWQVNLGQSLRRPHGEGRHDKQGPPSSGMPRIRTHRGL